MTSFEAWHPSAGHTTSLPESIILCVDPYKMRVCYQKSGRNNERINTKLGQIMDFRGPYKPIVLGDLGLKGLAVVLDIEVKIVKIGPGLPQSVLKLEQKVKRETIGQTTGFQMG